MATKLETFLSKNKIDHRRLLSASRLIERLRPADRQIKLKQTQARKSEDGKKPEGLDKPRTGRPLTPIGLQRALAGQDVSGPMKNRVVRAVNHILEQKKQSTVTIDALFDVPAPGVPKPKAEAASGDEAKPAEA